VRPLAAVDLDQTVLFTRHASDGTLVEELAPGLDGLAEVAVLLPVTTRTVEQFARVGLHSELAVCANGAVLLRDGAPDPDWADWARQTCAAAAPLAEVAAHIGIDAEPPPWVHAHRVAAEAFVYVVAHRREDIPAGWLAELGWWLAGRGWSLSVQGRKVYAVPAGLTKAAAVARVLAALGQPVLLAAGDALLDAELLAAADAAIRPAHGELHEQGSSCRGLHVTTASGPAAGAEIVAWLTDRALTPSTR